ncbi:putative HTH-type transcriptional regulator YvnA [Paenibacillus lautus]|uniref:MarR family transcriptional regulator n=1 Tax=Paenibacillus lautus TaxID=1401 RepID=UPI001B10FAA6|nr:MarR family transcriptional regulator [Paenibacillus lautus]GIO99630.1 putative HTH-type transcriptional regulator YvnA [Paenibacillus lautus]
MTLNKRKEAIEAVQYFIMNREKNIRNRSTSIESTVGSDSVKNWSMTQLHILSLVKRNPCQLNNTSLATELNLSKSAITKAINTLIQHHLVVTAKKTDNLKEIYYEATDQGKQLATAHDKLHHQAEEKYYELFSHFNDEEIDVIIRFLNAWLMTSEYK